MAVQRVGVFIHGGQLVVLTFVYKPLCKGALKCDPVCIVVNVVFFSLYNHLQHFRKLCVAVLKRCLVLALYVVIIHQCEDWMLYSLRTTFQGFSMGYSVKVDVNVIVFVLLCNIISLYTSLFCIKYCVYFDFKMLEYPC